MMEVQSKLGEQSKNLTPEMWSQFMGLQSPLMQGMMGKNLDQSKNIFTQMQEQMQKQTEQMLGSFGVKR
jgi:polyhydroxyalkanoate synthesis regulator protein